MALSSPYIEQLLKSITEPLFVVGDSFCLDFVDGFLQLLLVPHVSLYEMIETTDVLSFIIELGEREKERGGERRAVNKTEKANEERHFAN